MLANVNTDDLGRLVQKLTDLEGQICSEYTKIMQDLEGYRGRGDFAAKIREASRDIFSVSNSVHNVLSELKNILRTKSQTAQEFDQSVKTSLGKNDSLENLARTAVAGATILSAVNSGFGAVKNIASTAGSFFEGSNDSGVSSLNLNGVNLSSANTDTASAPSLATMSSDNSPSSFDDGSSSSYETAGSSFSGGYGGLYGSSAAPTSSAPMPQGLGSSTDLFGDTSGSTVPTTASDSGIGTDGTLNMANQDMDSDIDSFGGSYGSYGNLNSTPDMSTTGFSTPSAIPNQSSGSGWKYAAAGGALVGAAGLAAMLAKKKNSEAQKDSDYDLGSTESTDQDNGEEAGYDWNSTPDDNGGFGI